MVVYHITRGDTPDELWKSENDLKRVATIQLGLSPTKVLPNPHKSQLGILGPQDVLVAKSLGALLGVEDQVAQFPGESLKRQWAFLFASSAPPRVVLTEDPEGLGSPIDTDTDAAKWLAWAARFSPTPDSELPGQDVAGHAGHGHRKVHRNGVSVSVPDDAVEEVHNLIVRMYVEDRLSMGKIEQELKARNIRGSQGGRYTRKTIRGVLVDRGVRIRKSRIGQREGNRERPIGTK